MLFSTFKNNSQPDRQTDRLMPLSVSAAVPARPESADCVCVCECMYLCKRQCVCVCSAADSATVCPPWPDTLLPLLLWPGDGGRARLCHFVPGSADGFPSDIITVRRWGSCRYRRRGRSQWRRALTVCLAFCWAYSGWRAFFSHTDLQSLVWHEQRNERRTFYFVHQKIPQVLEKYKYQGKKCRIHTLVLCSCSNQ